MFDFLFPFLCCDQAGIFGFEDFKVFFDCGIFPDRSNDTNFDVFSLFVEKWRKGQNTSDRIQRRQMTL